MQEISGPGVAIAAVVRNGPAGRAGLRVGDIVTAVNGQAVEDSRALLRAVAAIPPGQTARLTLQRQGREMELSVTVGRRPNDGGLQSHAHPGGGRRQGRGRVRRQGPEGDRPRGGARR